MDSDTSTWMTIVHKVLGLGSDSLKTAKDLLVELSEKVNIKNFSFELLKTVEFWTVVVCLIFAFFILFRGIAYKKISLFPFVALLVYEFIRPFILYFFKAAEYVVVNIIGKSAPEFLKNLVKDEATFYYVASVVLAIFALSFYKILIYIAIVVIASELRKFVLSFVEFSDAPFVVSVVLLVVFIFVAKKIVDVCENIVLAAIFALNGSLFFLTIVSILFGEPSGFVDFVTSVFEWKNLADIAFDYNLALWLGIAIVGFFAQIYSKGILNY